jgi:hypothetical protein
LDENLNELGFGSSPDETLYENIVRSKCLGVFVVGLLTLNMGEDFKFLALKILAVGLLDSFLSVLFLFELDIGKAS